MNARILTTLLGFCFMTGGLHAQGTAFSYQGRLDQGGTPVTGNFNFQFQLYTNATVGNQFGGPIARNGVLVTNGLFTVSLDFGSTAFFGWPLWLQMWVAPSNQPQPALTLLSPRQPVTPAPYAFFASTASNASANAVSTVALQNNSVTAPKIQSGQVVKSLNGLTDSIALTAGANVTITPGVNSLQISALGAGTGWGLTGNQGTTPAANYIGASDNALVRLHAAGGFLVDNTTPSLSFGNERRQMLNLWNSTYGIGVQDNTLYQRSADHFAWHRGGSHSNAIANPGSGGSLLMVLDSAGRLGLGTNAPQASVHIAGGGILRVDGPAGEQAYVSGGNGNVGLGSLNPAVNAVSLWNLGSGSFMDLMADQITASQFNGPFSGSVNASSLRLGTISLRGSVMTSDAFGNAAWNAEMRFYDASGSVFPSSTLEAANLLLGKNGAIDGGALGATLLGGGYFVRRGAPFFDVVERGSNYVGGDFATAMGGRNNSAVGDYSLAIGHRAKANHDGSFVWSDSQNADFASTVANEFSIRASGGARFDTNTSLYFGNQTRQMLNLWGTGFGVGVQTATFYERTEGDFAWYVGGSHDHSYGQPGVGGLEQMRLRDNGLTIRGAGNERPYLGADGAGGDVEIGSQNPSINTVALWNRGAGTHMDLFARDASVRVLTIRGGADLAEPFQMSEANIPKGSLVVIDEANAGKLKLSDREYDTRVAGIVSGANGVNAGITLQQEGLLEGGQNVALSGRVYALADATQGAIKPGDLLTSSSTPGHVTAVRDPARAAGAIVGKAMSNLAEGKGMVLVLVSLQ